MMDAVAVGDHDRVYVRELSPVARIRMGYSFDEQEMTDWELHLDFFIDGAWREGVYYSRTLGARALKMSNPDSDDMTDEELEEATSRLRELSVRVHEDSVKDVDDKERDEEWVRRMLGRDLRHEG